MVKSSKFYKQIRSVCSIGSVYKFIGVTRITNIEKNQKLNKTEYMLHIITRNIIINGRIAIWKIVGKFKVIILQKDDLDNEMHLYQNQVAKLSMNRTESLRSNVLHTPDDGIC